jgi:hypothetical protein
MHLLRGAGELLHLGLILFIFLQLFLVAALLFHGVKAVIAAVNSALPSSISMQREHTTSRKYLSWLMASTVPRKRDIILQPFRGVEIQMVGGLVQQQDVRILQNEPAQVHPGLLPAGEAVEGLGAHGVG